MNRYTKTLEVAWQNPKYVFVNDEELERVAQQFAQEDLKTPDWRHGPVFPETDDDTFIRFIVVGNAINYCFTDFETGKSFDIDVEYPEGSGHPCRGAFAMLASLKRAYEQGINILDPDVLEGMTEKKAKFIFRHLATPIPMLAERAESLRNLGQTMKRMGIKNFSDLFRGADFYAFNDGNGIVEVLVDNFECYRDTSAWHGRLHTLEFQKRAQLLPMMYHGRALASNGALQPLRDPENIGPVCDYELPKAFRSLGITAYDKELAGMVDSGTIIEAHSEMEIELRASGCALPMVRLLEKINELRRNDLFSSVTGLFMPQITMAELDFEIWSMGKKAEGRHHYTYTTAY